MKRFMGAPFRSWCIRIVVTLVSFAAVGATLSLAVPFWTRLLALVIAALVGAAIAFRVVPAFDPRGRVRWRLPGQTDGVGPSKRCAITFDDGPTEATARVLDILAAEGVPATFFVLGGNVERHPDLVRRAQAEGHAVGIHGMSHAKLVKADEASVAEQVNGVTAA